MPLLHITISEEVERIAIEHVDNVTRVLFEAFDTHYISASHLKMNANDEAYKKDEDFEDEEYSWTFITALFFTATLLTTIGKCLEQSKFKKPKITI